MGVMDISFEDVLPDTPSGVCCCGCCSLTNFLLIILFFPCTVIQLGQFQYGLAKNKLTGTVNLDTTFTPGRYWIGFWQDFITFPSTLNTIEFSDEKPEVGVQHLFPLSSRDRDGKMIRLDVSIQYRLKPEALGRIYRDMTTLYEDVYISDLRDRLSKAANQFKVSQVWTEYSYVAKQMLQRCKEMLAPRGAECWNLQLYKIEVSEKYQNQITYTQVKKQKQKSTQAQMIQAQIRAETAYLLASYTKRIMIMDASATAHQINIERYAIAAAQANLVKAQADVLRFIKQTVHLYTATNGAYNGTNLIAPELTDKELVIYQRYVMAASQAQSHIVANLADGFGQMSLSGSR